MPRLSNALSTTIADPATEFTLKGGLGPDIRPENLPHYTADTLTDLILDGIPGTPMPPWRPLITEAEAAWIARYLLEENAS